MDLGNRYVDPFAGPPGSRVQPWRRPGVLGSLVAVIVVALVIAFLVVNRTDDVPAPADPPRVVRPAP